MEGYHEKQTDSNFGAAACGGHACGVYRVEWDWCQERSEYVVLRYLYKKDFMLRLYRMEINYKIDSRYYVGKVKKKGGKIWIAGNEQITIL